MNEKLTITVELEKEKVSALFYLLGAELTPERWKVLSENAIPLNLETLDNGEKRAAELLFISLAISTMELE